MTSLLSIRPRARKATQQHEIDQSYGCLPSSACEQMMRDVFNVCRVVLPFICRRAAMHGRVRESSPHGLHGNAPHRAHDHELHHGHRAHDRARAQKYDFRLHVRYDHGHDHDCGYGHFSGSHHRSLLQACFQTFAFFDTTQSLYVSRAPLALNLNDPPPLEPRLKGQRHFLCHIPNTFYRKNSYHVQP